MSEPVGPPAPPTPEELAALIARTPVRDVLLQSMATFIDMAGIRLGLGPSGDEARDLVQARQAIEALRALLGVAEREIGAAQVRPFKEPLAVLQMAYARAAETPPPEGEGAAGAEAPAEGAAEAGSPPVDPDAASRLWVPPGTPRKPR